MIIGNNEVIKLAKYERNYILLIGGSLSGVTPVVEGGLKSVYVAA